MKALPPSLTQEFPLLGIRDVCYYRTSDLRESSQAHCDLDRTGLGNSHLMVDSKSGARCGTCAVTSRMGA